MIVLIDNGHGANTPGKCSPDKQIREYSYAREIASLLEQNVVANLVSELLHNIKVNKI